MMEGTQMKQWESRLETMETRMRQNQEQMEDWLETIEMGIQGNAGRGEQRSATDIGTNGDRTQRRIFRPRPTTKFYIEPSVWGSRT